MFNCAKVQFFYLVLRTLEVIASETTALRAYPSHAYGAGPSRSQAHGRPWFLKLLPLKFCSFGNLNTYLIFKWYFTNPSPPTKRRPSFVERIGASETSNESGPGGPPSGMEWSAFAKRNKKRNIFESIFTHKNRRPLGRLFLWVKMDSNHRSRETADLQSAPFGHSGIHPA